MATAGSKLSISPSVDRFAEVLSEVPSWYNLGVYLGAPMVELDIISRAHSDGTNAGTLRCLMELYRCLERKGKLLSWETITSALKRMGDNGLADKIHTIVKEQLASIEPRPLPSGTYSQQEAIDVPSTLSSEYEVLSKRFIILLTDVKLALISVANLNMNTMQDLIKRQCGLPRLPQEVATIDTVFDRVEEECSILNFCLLELLIEKLLSNNRSALEQDLKEFKQCIDCFKSSANMVELVTLVKSKQTTPTGDQRIVQLKVREFWNRFTMKQFEIIINTIFKALYSIMTHITVTEGCICLNWIIPDIDTTELLPVLPLELVRLIGVIYLHIGSDVIYNIEGEGCESIETAMLQAIELKNTRAIELLLAVGCNPEVATYNGDNAVTNIVNIRAIESKEASSSGSSHSVDHVCILGHNKHVEAIFDPSASGGNEPEECSSCIVNKKMVKYLYQENDVLQQKQREMCLEIDLLSLTIKNKDSELDQRQLLRAEEKGKFIAGNQLTEAPHCHQDYADDLYQKVDTLQPEKKELNKEKEALLQEPIQILAGDQSTQATPVGFTESELIKMKDAEITLLKKSFEILVKEKATLCDELTKMRGSSTFTQPPNEPPLAPSVTSDRFSLSSTSNSSTEEVQLAGSFMNPTPAEQQLPSLKKLTVLSGKAGVPNRGHYRDLLNRFKTKGVIITYKFNTWPHHNLDQSFKSVVVCELNNSQVITGDSVHYYKGKKAVAEEKAARDALEKLLATTPSTSTSNDVNDDTTVYKAGSSPSETGSISKPTNKLYKQILHNFLVQQLRKELPVYDSVQDGTGSFQCTVSHSLTGRCTGNKFATKKEAENSAAWRAYLKLQELDLL